MRNALNSLNDFGSKDIFAHYQQLGVSIRALHIPDFDVFAILVQNTTKDILSKYNEDYDLCKEGNNLFFAGHFLNDINRNFNVCLDLPRGIFAIGERINLIELNKQELSDVSAFEEIAEKFRMLMKLFQDAVHYAQCYRKEITYSPLCPVSIAWEGIKQFKEDTVKIAREGLVGEKPPKERGQPKKYTIQKAKQIRASYDKYYKKLKDSKHAWNRAAKDHGIKSGKAAEMACRRYLKQNK